MLCARGRRSFQAEDENSPQIMADPIKCRGARPLKGGVQPSQGSGVPSDLGYQANSLEVKGPPLEVSVLPTKTVKTWPLPTLPQGVESLSDAHSSSVRSTKFG